MRKHVRLSVAAGLEEHSGYNPVELSRGAERLWGLYGLDLEEVELYRVGRRSFWKAMVGLETGEEESS